MQVKYVRVKFSDSLNNRTYEFQTDLNLKKGDLVVVECTNGLQVAGVTSISDTRTYKEGNRATAWVVCKIDREAHDARVLKWEEIQKVQAQLRARYDAAKELEVYRILAEKDPEMAALLDKLNDLTSAE